MVRYLLVEDLKMNLLGIQPTPTSKKSARANSKCIPRPKKIGRLHKPHALFTQRKVSLAWRRQTKGRYKWQSMRKLERMDVQGSSQGMHILFQNMQQVCQLLPTDYHQVEA